MEATHNRFVACHNPDNLAHLAVNRIGLRHWLQFHPRGQRANSQSGSAAGLTFEPGNKRQISTTAMAAQAFCRRCSAISAKTLQPASLPFWLLLNHCKSASQTRDQTVSTAFASKALWLACNNGAVVQAGSTFATSAKDTIQILVHTIRRQPTTQSPHNMGNCQTCHTVNPAL